MKNHDKQRAVKASNASIIVNAILSEPGMIKALVNKLADRRYDIGYCLEKMQPGWRALDTSSIEANVSGKFIIFENSGLFCQPFDNSFLFTCLKEKGDSYNLTWAISLS